MLSGPDGSRAWCAGLEARRQKGKAGVVLECPLCHVGLAFSTALAAD